MNLTIEIPDEFALELEARAHKQGVSADRLVSRIVQSELGKHSGAALHEQSFETGYGMLSKYGAAPSTEEIEENRRDMFRGFGE